MLAIVDFLLWRKNRKISLLHFEPMGTGLHPVFHFLRGFGPLYFLGDFFWNENPAKKRFENMNLFDFDEVSEWGGVRDSNHLPFFASISSSAAPSLSKSSAVYLLRTSYRLKNSYSSSRSSKPSISITSSSVIRSASCALMAASSNSRRGRGVVLPFRIAAAILSGMVALIVISISATSSLRILRDSEPRQR